MITDINNPNFDPIQAFSKFREHIDHCYGTISSDNKLVATLEHLETWLYEKCSVEENELRQRTRELITLWEMLNLLEMVTAQSYCQRWFSLNQ